VTVTLAVGYVVLRWPIPNVLKFVAIGTISFCLTVGAYEYPIRRVNVLRFMFGMRPLPRNAPPAGSPPLCPAHHRGPRPPSQLGETMLSVAS
jgi:hypothetical protein